MPVEINWISKFAFQSSNKVGIIIIIYWNFWASHIFCSYFLNNLWPGLFYLDLTQAWGTQICMKLWKLPQPLCSSYNRNYIYAFDTLSQGDTALDWHLYLVAIQQVIHSWIHLKTCCFRINTSNRCFFNPK